MAAQPSQRFLLAPNPMVQRARLKLSVGQVAARVQAANNISAHFAKMENAPP
jgi:hypothetical protein